MAELRLDPSAMAELLRGPKGPVARFAIEIGERVKLGAKRRVGVDTGNLRDHIVKRFGVRGGQIEVTVGAEVDYAVFHHEGTRPHVITPRKSDGVLAFDVDGQRVFARRVHHPGTRPNRFLTDAARAEGLSVQLVRGGLR